MKDIGGYDFLNFVLWSTDDFVPHCDTRTYHRNTGLMATMQRRSDKNLAYRNVADPKIEVDLCEQCSNKRTDNSALS